MPSTKELDAVIAAAKAFGPLAALAEQAGAIKGFEAHLARLKVDCDDMERVREEKAIKLAKVSGELKAEQDRATENLAELSAAHQQQLQRADQELAKKRQALTDLTTELASMVRDRVQLIDAAVISQTAESVGERNRLQEIVANLRTQQEGLLKDVRRLKATAQEIEA